MQGLIGDGCGIVGDARRQLAIDTRTRISLAVVRSRARHRGHTLSVVSVLVYIDEAWPVFVVLVCRLYWFGCFIYTRSIIYVLGQCVLPLPRGFLCIGYPSASSALCCENPFRTPSKLITTRNNATLIDNNSAYCDGVNPLSY